MTEAYKPTEEQQRIKEIIDKTKDNLLINAYAGSGKTTTLKMVAPRNMDVLYLAFNKQIVTDAELEQKEVWKTGIGTCFPENVDIRTFNGQGHRIWGTTISGKLWVDKDKTKNILYPAISELRGGDKREASDKYFEIVDAYNKAKALGYIPKGKYNGNSLITKEEFHQKLDERPSPFIADFIDSTLEVSIQAAYEGRIDFNDQIYMPALFGGSFPRYPLVLVDEAQDLNPTNHALLDKLGRERICAVGDRWQSIYAFRGALVGGMDRLKEKFGMVEADLSVSFRCPRTIVEAAQWRAPRLRWLNEGGHVEVLRSLSPLDIPYPRQDENGKWQNSVAIICRNNAPLFRIALSLLAEGRSVRVAGSDIGPRIIRIMEKLGNGDTPRSRVLAAIEEWKLTKLQTSNAPKTVDDMAECMKVFAAREEKLSHSIARLRYLFAQEGTLHLTTGHKAKGLEWETVYHLDPDLIGTDEQELNLKYVITTRSAKNLYTIQSKELEWMRNDT